MLRRTFLTLLGAVVWPWRKAEAVHAPNPAMALNRIPSDGFGGWSSAPVAHELGRSITHHREVELVYMQKGKRVVVRCELENPGGHPIKFIPVRNVSGQRIEAGALVKLVDDDNGVTPV